MSETTAVSGRGGRGRGGLEGRGRARGDRGRAGRGGRAAAHTNGTRVDKPAMSTTVNVMETTVSAAAPESGAIEKSDTRIGIETATTESGEGAKDASKSSVIPEGSKKDWASLFAKPAPPQQKPPTVPSVPAPEKASEPAAETKAAELAQAPALAPTKKAPDVIAPRPTETAVAVPSAGMPTRDDLTRTNLEQIPDASAPAPTATTASTMGSVHDPNHIAAAGTPSRAPPSAYNTPSAFKQSGRVPGFQRRVMGQQEAVVMPGNHAVDRAAVQFGSMGLNGDSAGVNIDDHREQAETRAQPPQHSPVAPRASLPPSTHPQQPTEAPAVSRPAPGLPPVPQVNAADTSFTDFGRYADAQKSYDPFSQQAAQPQPQVQEPFANQAPAQPTVTTGSEYSPFYTVDQRLPYNYYAAYGQSQDATLGQRATAGFGVSTADMQPHVPTSQPPSRYAHVDAPNSGHTTPNPTLPGTTQAPTAQHMPTQATHGYGYGYPYYSNPHYASYMNQMNQHQYGRNRPMYDDARRYDDHYMPHTSQYGYGSQYAPYGKAGMYGQPHGFSYEHASSPAAGFNQTMPGRDSAYGRTGSAQPTENQQPTNAFGSGMTDVFGRSQAGFGQNQPIAQQPPVTAEETKSFDTPKAGGGPSPSLAQTNRPGSATNSSMPGQPPAQGLPPLHAQQTQPGLGTYPNLNPQFGGGLGALGGQQAAATQAHHPASGYGNYAGTGFGNYYGNTRGGWGGNYGH